jgi:hypothetical protein
MERVGRTGDYGMLRTLAPLIRQEYARVEVALERHQGAGGSPK